MTAIVTRKKIVLLCKGRGKLGKGIGNIHDLG